MKYVYMEDHNRRVQRYKVIKYLEDNKILVRNWGALEVINRNDIVSEAPDPWWVVAFQMALVGLLLYGAWKWIPPCH